MFFIDRSLGRRIADYLRPSWRADEIVELHDDHFPQDTPDTVWLASVGEREWIVLTKDVHIRTNLVERDAVLAARVAVFALARGHATAEMMADTFALALGPIRSALKRFLRPLVGTIASDGTVTIRLAGGVKLTPPKVLKPQRARSR